MIYIAQILELADHVRFPIEAYTFQGNFYNFLGKVFNPCLFRHPCLSSGLITGQTGGPSLIGNSEFKIG